MLNESEYFGQQKLFHGEVPAVLGSKLGALLCDVEESISGQFWGRLCSICDEVEAHLNGGNPQSELGRFNSGKMLAHSEVGDCLAAAVDLSKEYLRLTGGLFDPALGKMNYVDHDEDDGSLSLYGVKLDFGSFAKGYLLRRIQSLLKETGITSAFVNLGNYAFLAVGSHPCGEDWKISLSNPYSHMPIEDVPLKDSCLALSCNAPGASARVIHPKTLKGNDERKMVVVTGTDILDVKVAATALMISDEQQVLDIKRNFPEIETRFYKL